VKEGDGWSDHHLRVEAARTGDVIRKILLVVDATNHAREAEALAAELAIGFSAEVIVLHVRQWILGPAGPFDEGTQRSTELVDGVAGRLRERGVRVRPEVRSAYFAHTAREIVEAASEDEADLIVMGSHGASGIMPTVLGRVTHKLLQLTHVPVLVAAPRGYAAA
jgi:nucleotide-binding universal stress UspA family protein